MKIAGYNDWHIYKFGLFGHGIILQRTLIYSETFRICCLRNENDHRFILHFQC